MKKFTFFLIFFSLILPPAAGAQKTVFRLGTLPVIDTLPLILADQEDLFNKEGLTVQFYQFNSALERDAALSSGKLDGYFGDLVITMLLNESGQNIKVLCESYHTLPRHRMFAIAAAPGSEISSAADIKDIPVAISTGSVIEFMLDRILLKNNLDPAAINKTEVKAIPIRYQMLITGTLKLALLPEPLATRAEQEGAKIIADDRLLDTTATIIAVKQDFILRNPDFAAAFMRAYAKSAAMINADPQKYIPLLAAKTRFPKELEDSYKMPAFPEDATPKPEAINAVSDWLMAKKMLKSPVTHTALVMQREPSH